MMTEAQEIVDWELEVTVHARDLPLASFFSLA